MKKTYRDPITGKKIGMIVHDSGVKTFKVWSTDETWSEPPDKTFQLSEQPRKPEVDFSFMKELLQAPSNHSYLITKKIPVLTAKIQENYLVIPFQNQYGEIKGAQKIFPNGKKINFTGSIKTGTFHIIPGDNQTTYLVEGFATGASVHEATGAKVIVAFGTGNFKNVLEHFTNEKIIIAADNDEAGIKAAKSTGLPYTYPPIEKMDWNDFAQAHTLVEVTKALAQVSYPVLTNEDDEKYPFLFLGHDEKTKEFFFFHKESKSIYSIEGENITQGKLIYLCDLSFWEKYKTQNGNINLKLTTNFIARESFKSGKYIKDRVRGTGVWLENNQLVINGLEKIWKDGKESKFGKIGQHIYISENSPFLELTEPVSLEKSQKLFSLLQKLSWKNSTSADYLLGWVMLAPLAGALSVWRPHLWVTGGKGSGKSEVKKEIIMPLMNIFKSDNLGTSEAGIRQGRQMSAIPLIYDEAEVTDYKTKQLVNSVIKTICLASDSDSKVSKGSAEHKEHTFYINFCACLFSIGVSLEEPQYRSRFTILELVEDKSNGYSEKGGTKEQIKNLLSGNFRNEFFSASISQFENYLSNFDIFYERLKDKYSSRFAQQIGSLLAASFTMQFFKIGTLKEVENFLSLKDLIEESNDNSSKNEQECLEYLFSKKIVETGQSYTIGELIEDVQSVSDVSEREKKEKLLMHHGIKYLKNEDTLAISNTGSELKNLFRGTQWETGWSRSLSRLPYVFKKSYQVWFNGQNQRCICIDLLKRNEMIHKEKNV